MFFQQQLIDPTAKFVMKLLHRNRCCGNSAWERFEEGLHYESIEIRPDHLTAGLCLFIIAFLKLTSVQSGTFAQGRSKRDSFYSPLFFPPLLFLPNYKLSPASHVLSMTCSLLHIYMQPGTQYYRRWYRSQESRLPFPPVERSEHSSNSSTLPSLHPW